ncbi:MAG TPA: PP2C family protein-serine/threonine phosphatase [Phycisphaerales bacterium]|nr:PP2C family protein-serine/threonine phosphatase [Phycisphaerales bacterium]
MAKKRDRDFFWSTIPPRGRVLFFGGVFCIFAPSMVLPARLSDPAVSAVLAALVAAGLIGMFWALAFTRSLWFLVGALGVQGLTILGYVGLAPAWLWVRPQGFAWVGGAAILCIVAGYTLFVLFINTEGKRSIRERTELALAQQIHSRLVPPVSLVSQGYEVAGRSIPSAEVGGDLVDLVRDGDRVELFLGDVSGHGVRSGVVMAMTKAAIHTARRAGADLSRVLGEVNSVLTELTDPGMFVTFAALRAEPGGLVSYALAGHLPVLHWRAATGGIVRLENESLPLGVAPGIDFPTRTVHCAAGDLLVVLTDGLIEVAGPDGRQLGLGGFERLLRELADRPVGELLDALVAQVRRVGPVGDDQTLLLIRAA